MKKLFLIILISLCFMQTDLGSKSLANNISLNKISQSNYLINLNYNSNEEIYLCELELLNAKNINNSDSILKIKEKQNLIQINLFLDKLAKKESSCNWKAYNRYGYMGKYQFGKIALKSFNLYPKINIDSFKIKPEIFPIEMQDSLVLELMHDNKNYLNYYIKKYNKKYILDTILVNDASVLAAAHLVGMGNMEKFFKSIESNSIYIPKDGNKVPATKYMKDFENFNFIL